MPTRRLLLPTPALLIRPARAAALPFGALRGATTAADGRLTPQAMALIGSRVTIPGFMAPPLNPKLGFCSHSCAHVNVHVLQQRLRLASRNCVRAPYPRRRPGGTALRDRSLRHAWVGCGHRPGAGFVSLVRLIGAVWTVTQAGQLNGGGGQGKRVGNQRYAQHKSPSRFYEGDLGQGSFGYGAKHSGHRALKRPADQRRNLPDDAPAERQHAGDENNTLRHRHPRPGARQRAFGPHDHTCTHDRAKDGTEPAQ